LGGVVTECMGALGGVRKPTPFAESAKGAAPGEHRDLGQEAAKGDPLPHADPRRRKDDGDAAVNYLEVADFIRLHA
jgi:hypothetical protein